MTDWRRTRRGEDLRRCDNDPAAAFGAAERTPDPEERSAFQTFAIFGAGPTDVELVGGIAELMQNVAPREFSSIDTWASRVMLIEAGPRVLASFPKKLSYYAKTALERLSVEVMIGALVTHMDADGLTVGGEPISTHTKICAAPV